MSTLTTGRYLLIFFLAILNINLSQASENHTGSTMNVLESQPIFSIRVNTFGIKYILKVNGVTVFRETSSNSQLTTTIPINHWMKSGNNTIEAHIRPPKKGLEYNPNARLEYELLVKSNSDQSTSHSILKTYVTGASANKNSFEFSTKEGSYSSTDNFSPSKNGNIKISETSIDHIQKYKGGLIYLTTLDIPSSLPLWNFFKSDNIPDIESMSDEDYYHEIDKLLIEYMKVFNAIKTKQTDSIISIFNERNKETDAAYYLTNGDTESGIKNALYEASSDNNLELVPLDRKKVNFTIEQNRKLARLSRKGITPAIGLNAKDGSGSQRFQMYFRYENNKWILTR